MSASSVHRRTTCRICDSASVERVISLKPTPLANAFLRKEQLADPEPVFPLDLFFCAQCGHLQLLDVVDPALLFRNYVYVSSTSPSFVEHFRKYAEELVRDYRLPAKSLVVEIGSNDGVLLKHFKTAGMNVLGVDPAVEIAKSATAAGIPTIPDFFTLNRAREIRREHGAAAVVAANNVFAHADDLHGILDGVRELLAPDGVFVFEVSYLLDVYEKTLFDMTYHEHVSYHSVKPLEVLFSRHGMELIDTRRVPTHGGSLRGIAQLKGGPHPRKPSVQELLALEAAAGLDRKETFIEFGRNIAHLKNELGKVLNELKSQGKHIGAFGAPAKLTTLMHHFELGPDVIDFVVDDSPLKQGLFTPGHHIPVLPVAAMYERKPDCMLLLAWNFATPILKQHQRFMDEGGRFIIPLPKLEVRSS